MRVAIFFAVFLGFAGFGFSETVYAWGYGDILAEALHGIKRLFATGELTSAFKIFLALSLFLGALSYFFSNNRDPLTLLKIYLIASLVYTLGFTAKTTVVVEDLRRPANNEVIEDVPWLPAFLLSFSSKFEKAIGEAFETAFSVPSELSYSQSGFFSGLGAIWVSSQHIVIDPYLYRSVNEYIIDCVVPDILDGSKDLNQLVVSQNLWQDLGGTSPARTTKVYSSTNKQGELMTCPDAYSEITSRLQEYIQNRGLEIVGSALGGFGIDKLNQLIGAASTYFFNVSYDAQNFLLQAIAMNHMSEAYQRWAAVNGISGDMFNYGLAKSERQLQSQMAISGILGSKYIPVIKGILVVVIASLLPLFLLLLITPLGKKTAIGLFITVFWLALWRIGDVIVNMIVSIKAKDVLLTASGGDGYTLLVKPVVDYQTIDYINMVGSFYWAIPTVALLVASGLSVYVFSSLAGRLGSSVQASAGAASGELTTGNVSSGNVSLNNRDFSYDTYFGVNNNVSHTFRHSYGISQVGSYENYTKISGYANTPIGQGFVNGTVSGDGTWQISSFVGNNVRARDVSVGSDGQLVRGDFFASSLQDFARGIRDKKLVSAVQTAIEKAGWLPNEVLNLTVHASENGYEVKFLDDEGNAVTMHVSKDGSYSYTVERGGSKVGGGELGITGVQNLPVNVNASHLLSSRYSELRQVEKAINEAHQLSQNWSRIQKALFSLALEKFNRGEITSKQLLDAYEDIKRMQIDGSGNLETNYPGIKNLLKKLGIKAQAGMELDSSRIFITKGGGETAKGASEGKAFRDIEQFSQDFSKNLQEALSKIENEKSALSYAMEHSEVLQKALNENLMPKILNKIMHEKQMDPGEALKYVLEHPDEVAKLAEKELFGESIENLVKSEISKSPDPSGISVDTTFLHSVRSDVEGNIEKAKKDTDRGLQELKEEFKSLIDEIKQGKEDTEDTLMLGYFGLGALAVLDVGSKLWSLRNLKKKDIDNLRQLKDTVLKEIERKNGPRAREVMKEFLDILGDKLKTNKDVNKALKEAEEEFISRRITKNGVDLRDVQILRDAVKNAGEVLSHQPKPILERLAEIGGKTARVLGSALAAIGEKELLMAGVLFPSTLGSGELTEKDYYQLMGLKEINGSLVVENSEVFKRYAKRLGLSDEDWKYGYLSPYAEEVIRNHVKTNMH